MIESRLEEARALVDAAYKEACKVTESKGNPGVVQVALARIGVLLKDVSTPDDSRPKTEGAA